MSLTHVDDETFETSVLKATVPVLVDYYADWCMHCPPLIAILEQLQTDYFKKIIIFKCDIEKNHKIRDQYNIRSLPTLMLFKEGNVISTRFGAMTRDALIEEFFKNFI
jgi:thioredoxin 1